MDRLIVEAIAGSNLRRLQRELGLERWEIRLAFRPAPPQGVELTRADNSRMVDYRSACIFVNTDAFGSEAEVVEAIRHELFHLVVAPFDLFVSAVERLGLDPETMRVLDRVREYAIERSVSELERLWSRVSQA
jgi:hypothetical protein